MKTKILEKIDQANSKQDPISSFSIGDTVKVSVKIKEGGKERVQAYSGTVIARKGIGSTKTFTVRRMSFGEGVERTFPLHSPHTVKIEVLKPARVRRAKLYYLRKRVGKTARVKTAR